MIIRLEGGTTEDLGAAQRSLHALAHCWGHELTEAPASATHAAGPARHGDKGIDPVALTALMLSLPSAALAVFDLADRIGKRRRAQELIDHARQLAAQHVTVCLMSPHRPVELAVLAPDQLLDLLAEQHPTS
jgi:hypothetical protein